MCTSRSAGCGRSEQGQYGRTVEAIEQPIAAPASSPVDEPAHTWFVRDVRSRTYGNPSSSCSPGLSTQGLGSSRTRRRGRRHGARARPLLLLEARGVLPRRQRGDAARVGRARQPEQRAQRGALPRLPEGERTALLQSLAKSGYVETLFRGCASSGPLRTERVAAGAAFMP